VTASRDFTKDHVVGQRWRIHKLSHVWTIWRGSIKAAAKFLSWIKSMCSSQKYMLKQKRLLGQKLLSEQLASWNKSGGFTKVEMLGRRRRIQQKAGMHVFAGE
jgi:hypothetical protein